MPGYPYPNDVCDSYEQELDYRRKYIGRLIQYARELLTLGQISDEEFQKIRDSFASVAQTTISIHPLTKEQRPVFRYKMDDLEAKGMTFYEQQVMEKDDLAFRTDVINPLQKQAIRGQAEANRYRNDLMPFLNAMVNEGKITPQQRIQELEKVRRLAMSGIRAEDMPNYPAVQQYHQEFEEFVRSTQPDK